MNNGHNASVAAQKRRLSDPCPDATPPPPQEQPEPKQRKTEQLQPVEQPEEQTEEQPDKQPEVQPEEQPEVQPEEHPDEQLNEQPEQQQQIQKSEQQGHNLLSFCDELLFEIFKYLDSPSILAVMHCSPRFETLLLDHRFWHNIDLSIAPLPLGILEEILGRATERTHTIKIWGPPSSQHVAGEFKQFTCTLTSVFPKVATTLQILELQGVSLDFEYIHISQFPASLKRLTLKDCSVKVGDHVKSIFHTIEKHLVYLEDLSIEDNTWFEPYYIMALSKLPSLRRLSLKGCQMMCKFVPYGSMAARFGFQKLEVLDLRLTPINNSDLQCFSAIENLKELLLESPPYLPQKATSLPKTSNSNGNGNEESASQPEQFKMLNDDEPSTSRAAMEHLRACTVAQNQEPGAEAPRAASDSFIPDNYNERREPIDVKRMSRRGGYASSESEDEDTSSTSASSSDKSDGVAAHSNAQNTDADANRAIRAPMVVIAMPGVSREPALAENAENNVPAPAGAGVPRAYLLVENGVPQPPMALLLEQFVDHLHTMRGMQPAHSRFLPRRDHVIHMNPQANAEPLLVMQSRRHRTQPRGNFEQVVQHPMFWNMLDPLDRDFARRLRSRPQSSPMPQCYVSDRAIYSFGRAAFPVQPEVVWIRNSNRSPNNRLERIQLSNYPHITNYTLEHLVQCSPNLIYIDVSGTNITLLGLRNFKSLKPNCEVVATHLTVDEQQTTAETDEVLKPPTETETEPEPASEVESTNENLSIDNEQQLDEL